jgi:GT2 family glycosyltransferase
MEMVKFSSVFAIIVTYNGMKWYDRCFGSLRRSIIPVKPVVIDNASSDGSVAYIREHFPEAVIMEQKENLGFAKANNVGMRYALDHGADFVFLLNQDAWLVQDDCLTQMITIAEIHPEFAILSPMQLYGDGKQIVYESKQYAARNEKNDWISDAYFNRLKDLYEVQYVCAASWLMPVNTLKTIGGFDPLFYHNGEDDNYMQRVHYHGMKVGICPTVNMCHDCGGRPKDYNAVTLDWRKYLLIQYCNINMNVDFGALLKSKRETIFFQRLRMNRKLLKTSVPEYEYLKAMKSQIEHSRAQNKIKGENWL